MNELKYVVYKHTTPDGKIYIGMTGEDPDKRFHHGRGYKHNKYFTKAIKENFWDWDKDIDHDIIYFNLTRKEAFEKEAELIQLYNSTNPEIGYNISEGQYIGVKKCYDDKKLVKKLAKEYAIKINNILTEMDNLSKSEAFKHSMECMSKILDDPKKIDAIISYSNKHFLTYFQDDEEKTVQSIMKCYNTYIAEKPKKSLLNNNLY